MKKLLLSFLSLLMIFTLCFTVNAEEREEQTKTPEGENYSSEEQDFNPHIYAKVLVDGEDRNEYGEYSKNVTISLNSTHENTKIYYFVSNDYIEELSDIAYKDDKEIPSNYSFKEYTDDDAIVTDAEAGSRKYYYIYSYLTYNDSKCLLSWHSISIELDSNDYKDEAKTELEDTVIELETEYTDSKLAEYEESSTQYYKNELSYAKRILSDAEGVYTSNEYYYARKELVKSISKFVKKGGYDGVTIEDYPSGGVKSIKYNKPELIQSILNNYQYDIKIDDIESIVINASTDENVNNDADKNFILDGIKKENDNHKEWKDNDGYYYYYNLNNLKYININLDLEVKLKDGSTKKFDNLYLNSNSLSIVLNVPNNLAYCKGIKLTYLFAILGEGEYKYAGTLGNAKEINGSDVEFRIWTLVSSTAAITYSDYIKDEVKEDTSTDTGSVTRTEANTPCEEWHKSKNWTWSAKANACVYRVTSTSSK